MRRGNAILDESFLASVQVFCLGPAGQNEPIYKSGNQRFLGGGDSVSHKYVVVTVSAMLILHRALHRLLEYLVLIIRNSEYVKFPRKTRHSLLESCCLELLDGDIVVRY